MKSKYLISKDGIMSIFMYLMIFLPPLFRVSMTYVLIAIMSVYIVVAKVSHRTLILKRSQGVKMLVFFMPFIVYALLQMVVNVISATDGTARSAYIYNFSHVVISTIYILVCYVFVNTALSQSKRYQHPDVTILMIVGVSVGVLTILFSFFNSGLHNSFLDLYFKNVKNEILLRNVSRYRWRAYGLSGYYFDNLAFILSGAGLISFLKAFESKKVVFYILGFSMFISSILGSRTGIVLIAVGLVIAMIYYGKRIGFVDMLKWIVVILISIVAIYYLLNLLSTDFRNWISSATNSIVALITERSQGDAFAEILGSDIVFPSNIIFGLGAKPETLGFYDGGGHYIDNGYIQCIWRFGVVGTILLIAGIIRFYNYIFKNSRGRYGKSIAIVLPILMLLYLLKFYPVSTYGAHIVYFVVPAILLSTDKSKEASHALL